MQAENVACIRLPRAQPFVLQVQFASIYDGANWTDCPSKLFFIQVSVWFVICSTYLEFFVCIGASFFIGENSEGLGTV